MCNNKLFHLFEMRSRFQNAGLLFLRWKYLKKAMIKYLGLGSSLNGYFWALVNMLDTQKQSWKFDNLYYGSK